MLFNRPEGDADIYDVLNIKSNNDFSNYINNLE